jgi:hypothetical protein
MNSATPNNKRKVFIYISDVASFIGQNKWDYVTPFERLWKKCDKEQYNTFIQRQAEEIENKRCELSTLDLQKKKLQDDLDNKRITSRQFDLQTKKVELAQSQINTVIEKIQDCVDDIDLTQQQKLEKAVGKDLIETIRSAEVETDEKRERFAEHVGSLDLPEEKLQAIREHGQSFINKTHGTLKEDSAIDMYEKKFGVKLDTSQQLHKRYLYDISAESSGYHWFICGKVDGLYTTNIQANNYIVEVKNRTRGFFNTLRDYEKTQIHLYMYMLEIRRSKLVEKFREAIRITDIYEDDDYTRQIVECLGVFLKTFEEKFLNNPKAKAEYLLKSVGEKERYIYRTFFVPVERHLNSMLADGDADVADGVCAVRVSADRDGDVCMIDDLD